MTDVPDYLKDMARIRLTGPNGEVETVSAIVMATISASASTVRCDTARYRCLCCDGDSSGRGEAHHGRIEMNATHGSQEGRIPKCEDPTISSLKPVPPTVWRRDHPDYRRVEVLTYERTKS
jgi:hypothetical protein